METAGTNDFIVNNWRTTGIDPKIVWRIFPHTVKGFTALLEPYQ